MTTDRVFSPSHWATAHSQVILSILFLLGFFATVMLQGLGYFKLDIISSLKDVLMLVMSFWFMRQRVSGSDPQSHPTVVNVPPTMPVPGPAK